MRGPLGVQQQSPSAFHALQGSDRMTDGDRNLLVGLVAHLATSGSMLTCNPSTAAVAAMIVLVGCRPTTRADVMLSNVNLIDVEAGQIVRGRDVLIEGNIIRHIFP